MRDWQVHDALMRASESLWGAGTHPPPTRDQLSAADRESARSNEAERNAENAR